MIFKIFRNQYFYLVLILALAFWLRLYRIDNPVADWHSWRQADTAAVARNFYKEGFNPLYPKYDDMIGIAQDPVPNPRRLRFVEFPIYNSLVYFLYLLNNGVDERLARLISIFMSLGSTVFIFLIVKKFWGIATAMLAALIFTALPFNVYFSRVILPEPTLVFFCLGMFYFVYCWIFENTRKLYWLSVFFTAMAFLIKPMAIFYLLPLLYVYYQKEQKIWPIPKRYYYWLVPSLVPLLFWRIWISQYPEGIPASNWLLNGDGIRFKPAFWKWIIGDRLGREILTIGGSILFFIGLLVKPKLSEGLLLQLLALSSFLFLIVFATGNVKHDYYQTLIVPALAMFTARGFIYLIKGVESFVPRIWTIPLAVFLLFLTFYLGWEEDKGFYHINNPAIVEAGLMADKILPKDVAVVAPYNGDTAFLYQVNRPGWAIVAFPIEELIEKFGIKYYVSVNYDAKTKWVMRKYRTILQTPNYVIVDLTVKIPGFDSIHDLEPM